MTGPAVVLLSAVFFCLVVLAVRRQRAREAVTVPTYATRSCEQCQTSIEPGDGVKAAGGMYCGDDCARWAW